MTRENILICYTDGSARPNPGYGGYGVYGYVYKDAKRPRNVNYPVKTNYKYTSQGIIQVSEVNKDSKLKAESIEVTDIVEHIGSVEDQNTTNNQCEILGFTTALKFGLHMEGIKEVLVISDSKYAIEGYNRGIDSWVKSGWLTKRGTEVKNRELWEDLLNIREELKKKNIKIKTKWVKGHDDSEGNVIADTYALIGTNYSWNQFNIGDFFKDHCLSKITPISQFKKELNDRHFLMNYNSAIFHTGTVNNDVMMLVSTFNPFVERDMGKRELYATYSLMLKGVPEDFSVLKKRFSNISRLYHRSCIINLDTLKKDKLLTRVINLVGFDPIYVHLPTRQGSKYMTFNRDGALIEELDNTYTHLLELYETFNVLEYGLTHFEKNLNEGRLIDLSEFFYDYKSNKLILTHKDRIFDISDKIHSDEFVSIGKFFVTIGMDTPNYSTFKSLEGKIKGVYVYPDNSNNPNLVTLTFIIVYEENGEDCFLATTNLLNKYLVKTK